MFILVYVLAIKLPKKLSKFYIFYDVFFTCMHLKPDNNGFFVLILLVSSYVAINYCKGFLCSFFNKDWGTN